MKGSGLLRLFSLIILISAATAWPWPGSLVNTHQGLILRRQEDSDSGESTSSPSDSSDSEEDSSDAEEDSSDAEGDSSDSEEASETITDAPEPTESDSAESTAADGTEAATTGASGSGSATASGSEESDASKTSEKASKTTKVDPRLPPGGIEMVTPATIAGPQYYKIGEYVTFAWNYTSLSVTPSHIDVIASCSANNEEYTLASNQTVDPTGEVTWDTGGYQATATAPLLTEEYTLIIMDADLDASATPKAGYLGISDQFTFGVYEPQPYTDLDNFQCATCNGALSVHERHALGFLLTMCSITILSFTWFAGGFGAFS